MARGEARRPRRRSASGVGRSRAGVASPRRTASGGTSTGPSSARSRRRGPRPGCAASCPRAARLRSGSRNGCSRRRGCGGRPRYQSVRRRIDPALELERDSAHAALALGTVTVRRLGVYSGPAADRRPCTSPGGQAHDLAVAAIDLRLEEEVGRQPLAARRIDAAERVLDQERRRRAAGRARRGSCSVTSCDGRSVNTIGHTVAEADVFAAGADHRAPSCASRRPAVAAVQEHDPVLDARARRAAARAASRRRSASPSQRSAMSAGRTLAGAIAFCVDGR